MAQIEIPKGWTAFFDATTKKVFGLSEFKNGGKADTALTLISKETKEELLAEFSVQGLTYVEPVAKPVVAPETPEATK